MLPAARPPGHGGGLLAVGEVAKFIGGTRGGAGGASAAGGTTGTVGCPPYQTLCNGTCLVTDSCGAAAIPVGAIVDQHAAATGNDNAQINLSPGAMANLGGTTRLDLPCGYYYLDSIRSSGSVTIYAHGHTALFIGGDASASILSFTVDPSGSLDVFVKGTLNSSADLVIGNPNYAALTRVYVGGTGLRISGEAHLAGLFYAAGSDLNLTSHITAYGSLYFKSFVGSGDNTDVHYDRAALRQGEGCGEPPPPPGCRSCQDCRNQACINGACGACRTSADCCAPLVCSGGTCIIIPG